MDSQIEGIKLLSFECIDKLKNYGKIINVREKTRIKQKFLNSRDEKLVKIVGGIE